MQSKLIVLVGVPGSGKSYFANKLKSTNPDFWDIISQDTIGSRKECETLFTKSIKRNKGVILDRCNVESNDRKLWLGLAFNPKEAIAIHFDMPTKDCIERVKNRVGHPTIKFGRGENIVKSFSKKIQPPTREEGFKKVITVKSIEESCNLLIKSGCKAEELDETIGLLKFPRTPVLFNYKKVHRDDIVLKDYSDFVGDNAFEVIVEEKVDGANLGISIDKDYNIILQNRSHYISSAYSAQFKSIDLWLDKVSGDLYSILKPNRHILYGEWLYARHSIHYDRLPDYFMAFDIFDKWENKFLSREKFYEALEGTQIIPVPYLMKKKFKTTDEVVKLLQTKSKFYDGPIEGVYLRIDEDDYLKKRTKLVRHDFIQTDGFWADGGIVKNRITFDHLIDDT